MRTGTGGLAALTMIVGVFIVGPGVGLAQYRWVDEQGVVNYSQFPPPSKAEPPPAEVTRLPAATQSPLPPVPKLSPGYERAIRDLIETFLGSGFFDVMLDQMGRAAIPAVKLVMEREIGRPLTSAEQQKLVEALRRSFAAVFPKSLWEDQFVTLYAKYFSEREVGEILRFYRTPVGAKAASLVAVLGREGATIGEQLAKSKQIEFTERLRQEMTRAFSPR